MNSSAPSSASAPESPEAVAHSDNAFPPSQFAHALDFPPASAPAPVAASTVPNAAQWFVCHTKPRCEKKFSALLKAEGVEYYLPLIGSVKRYGKQIKKFSKPLFAGYVFAKIVLENKARVYQQDLLVRLLPVMSEAQFLRQIEDVRTIVASGLEMSLRPLLQKGTRVRVTSGPLWGLEGVVDDPANPQGIIVSVDVLQQGLHVRMTLDDLEPLP